MDILEIFFDGNYYAARKATGEIVLGGPYDVDMVDGSDLTEVLREALYYADVVWMHPLPTPKGLKLVEAKEKKVEP
jgi:hypothetical protein